MNCHPKPQTTCGSTTPDTCIVYTGVWPSCFPNPNGDTCFRQNEFNEAAGNFICAHETSINCIIDSISNADATGCLVEGIHDCSGNTLPAQSIKANFQDLYDAVCSINVDLNLPVTGLTIPACIKDPCDNTPNTLGTLLQGILDQLVACCPDCSGS